MTKLYHEGGAWTVPGQQGRKALRVDVPSSPAELASWLNERGVPAISAASADLIRATQRTPTLATIDEELELTARMSELDDPATHDDKRRDYIERFRLAAARCPKCATSHPGALKLVAGDAKDQIVDWIAQTSELWAIEAIVVAARDRVADLKPTLTMPEQGGVQ